MATAPSRIEGIALASGERVATLRDTDQSRRTQKPAVDRWRLSGPRLIDGVRPGAARVVRDPWRTSRRDQGSGKAMTTFVDVDQSVRPAPAICISVFQTILYLSV